MASRNMVTGLLCAAVVSLGLVWHYQVSAAPTDDPAKKEPPQKELSEIDKLLKNLPPDLPPETVQMIRMYTQYMRQQMERQPFLRQMMEKEMARMIEQLKLAQPGFPPLAVPAPVFPGAPPDAFPDPEMAPGFPGGPASRQVARLGARVESPSETLREQLDLPREHGMIVKNIRKDSAAAKAGLKDHDILLELGGKAVSSKLRDFNLLVKDIKAETPVDAVVLRKGKKETLKGLSLPKPSEVQQPFPGGEFPGAPFPGAPFPGGQFPDGQIPQPPPLNPPFIPPVGAPPGVPGFPGFDGQGVMTTTFRTKDGFVTRHQEGSLIITLTGKAADGKATVQEIAVQDGRESSKFSEVDKVPEPYRGKVKNLVEMTEKSNSRIEVK